MFCKCTLNTIKIKGICHVCKRPEAPAPVPQPA